MSQTRQQLLDLARQYPGASEASLDVAMCVASEEDVPRQEALLNWTIGKNAAKQVRARNWLLFSFFPFVGVIVLLRSLKDAPVTEIAIAILTSLIITSMLQSLFNAADRGEEARRHLAKLAPIAGSDRCEEALKYIESGYADVQAWRDQALSERGQLYKFDVDVMQALYQLEDLKRSSTDRQRRNQEACRKLHGIDSVTA